MTNQFPLGPTESELSRGVDPRVLVDIGYPLPPGVDGSDERGDRVLADAFIESTDGPLVVAATDVTTVSHDSSAKERVREDQDPAIDASKVGIDAIRATLVAKRPPGYHPPQPTVMDRFLSRQRQRYGSNQDKSKG